MAGYQILLAADVALETAVRESISAHDARLLSVTPRVVSIPDRTLAIVADRALVAGDAGAQLAGRARRGVKWPAVLLLRPGERPADVTEPWVAASITPRDCQVRLQHVMRAAVIEWVLAATTEASAARYDDAKELLLMLRVILTANPPVPTLDALHRSTGISPKRQNALWNGAMRGSGLRLVEFLGWVVLLRALGVRAPRWGWRAVARGLDKSPHGLEGIAGRLFGLECDEIAADGLRLVIEFVERVLRPLGLDDGL